MKTIVRKYGAFLRIAAAEAQRGRGEIYGRAVFFIVILGVFTSLWRAVREAGMPIAADPVSLVWYLAMTEWIVLSAPPIHFEIQESIRRGDVVYQLGRPVSFLGAAFADGLGRLFVRAPALLAIAGASTFVLTGRVPPASVLAVVIPLGLGASALLTALYLGQGLLAFWLGDASPVWWVAQKALFVLGGLMMPLTLYPEAIQRIAAFTPFPAILAGPASLVLGGRLDDVFGVALALAAWSGATAAALLLMFRRAVQTLTVNGG